MNRKLMLLLLVCFAAATLWMAGCGDDKKPTKPKETTKPKVTPKPAPAPATEPAPTPPVTPPTPPEPEPEPPVTPPTPPEPPTPPAPPVTPPTPPTPPEPPTPPTPPAPPAAPEKVKTGWSDAKVGTMVKYKMQNNMTMTQEVTKVTDETVTVKVTTVIPNVPAMPARTQDFPRYGKPVPGGEEPKPQGKKLPDQTLTVGGKQIKCEVWEVVNDEAGKKMTSRSFTSKEVPGWMVKSESDAMGKMATMMELVEFKE